MVIESIFKATVCGGYFRVNSTEFKVFKEVSLGARSRLGDEVKLGRRHARECERLTRCDKSYN